MRTGNFLSLRLTDPGVDGLIDWLIHPDPREVTPRAAGYLNAHTANMALRRGSEMRRLLDGMDLVYPDGMSVVKEARRIGFPVSERVSAGDFFLRFCWAAAARGRSIALVGGMQRVLEGCAGALKSAIPGLQIVCLHDGYFPAHGGEQQRLFGELERLRPDVTIVGMGSPQQEAFALRLRDEIGLPTVWCVGALFEYHAPGVRKHAPLWMRERGLEWVYRLAQEPRRLAGRYLLGNVEFLLRARGII